MTATTGSPVPTSVPPAEDDPVRCPYCDRPFPRAHLRDLHVGNRHPDEISGPERERYEAAVDRESDDLFILHMKVIAGLVLAFFAIAYLYAFVLS